MSKDIIKELPKNALVPKEEQPYEVPGDWVWVKIGSITEVVGGGTPDSQKTEYYENGDIPWITPSDLSSYDDIYISRGKRNITKDGLKNSSAKLLPKDTILFSSRAPIGYVAIAANEICTNQGFKSFKPTSYFLPKYGYWYLKYAKPFAEALASGTTFPEISGSKAAQIPFALPPLPEQERIVDRIESLLGKINEAKKLIENIPEFLKQFRQAVLAASCSGKLTERWREKNTYLQSSTLLEQLKKAHEDVGGHKKGNASQPTDGVHNLSLDSLPEYWSIAELKDICKPTVL